jgi:hypothetical protein
MIRGIGVKLKSGWAGRSRLRLSELAAVFVFAALTMARAQHEHRPENAGPTNDVFNSIKALAGDWDGTFQWIGTTRTGPMNAKYYLTGNGSAVVEDLIADGSPNMTTVYHLDGRDLRATHYCAAGNQPRLKAVLPKEKADSINFEMIDITNLAKPEAGHVKGLELTLTPPNELTIRFTFTASGKEAVEQIRLRRTSNSAG